MTGSRCVICDFKFDEKFPRKFPKEWRLCCSCLAIAEVIARESVEYLYEDFITFWNLENEGDRELVSNYADRLENIQKLITMVM